MAVAANVVEATVVLLAVGCRAAAPGRVATALDHGRPTPGGFKMGVVHRILLLKKGAGVLRCYKLIGYKLIEQTHRG